MKPPVRVGLALGLAIGIALPLAILGVGLTHVVCNQGPALGSDGQLLAMPLDVVVPPPGGFVNYTSNVISNAGGGQSGHTLRPTNSTKADFLLYNWTAYSVQSIDAPGWGPTTVCPAHQLVPGTLFSGGSCSIAPPTPAGIDPRSLVPPLSFSCARPSAAINASYGATPFSNFSWAAYNERVQWSTRVGPADYRMTAGPFYEDRQLYGFTVAISLTSIQFGVPIP
jgi:hypothetical protein